MSGRQRVQLTILRRLIPGCRMEVGWEARNADLPTFVVVFELESKCTRSLKFVPICFVNSILIARECPGKEILPTYAGGNAQQRGSPVLAQVI
ncbi:hypothetical protein Y032_0012g1720 [Ancylostoma ceylanicum]|uniref:Uncharacterized protein n=1 Tax=Ancylostoma ceylanicum TaxID=53326 RepID=A0A016VCJ9_9BILA|nr:hypothetical protein Y032_0012g1720 [Ancylostoma ceylanicum]